MMLAPLHRYVQAENWKSNFLMQLAHELPLILELITSHCYDFPQKCGEKITYGLLKTIIYN